ncbi:MAG: hypothetical protein JOY59_08735 [Candidatus Eremiobacteraeota bacterium]|nr:hypothetical protein [Candidatus Eremiobacteraeota bacterium]
MSSGLLNLLGPSLTQSTTTSPSTSSTSSALDPFGNLNLTAAQEQQLQQIFQSLKNGSITPDQAKAQVNSVLTTDQQQTLQADIAKLKAGGHHGGHGGHHHHGGGGTAAVSAQSTLEQLDLTPAQQAQINQILSDAQASGASPSDVLSQIDGVLTDAQKSELASLIAGYTSSGTPSSASPSYVVDTNA